MHIVCSLIEKKWQLDSTQTLVFPASRFYADVLGGLLITEWSRRNVQSNADYYRMFQKEIMEAQTNGVSPRSLGVPDIKTDGDHAVSRFMIKPTNKIFQYTNIICGWHCHFHLRQIFFNILLYVDDIVTLISDKIVQYRLYGWHCHSHLRQNISTY